MPDGPVVPVEGAAGVVTLTQQTATASGRLRVDGAPAPEGEGNNEYLIPAISGPPLVATLVFAWTRSLPDVHVGGAVYSVGETIPAPLLVLASLPFVLFPIGGCCGGMVGGAVIAGNLAIARQPWPTTSKAIVILALGSASILGYVGLSLIASAMVQTAATM